MLVHCPDCNTTTEVEKQRVETVVEDHNNSQHNGDPVAGVGPDAVSLSDYRNNTTDPLVTHDMGDDAGPFGNHPNGVRAICKDCTLVALFDSEHTAADAVETHNSLKHNDDSIAGICEWDVESLPSAQELLEAGGLDALAALSSAHTP